MLVKNVSNRPHWVGDVLIAPTETKEISDIYANAINTADLVEVEGSIKESKKGKKNADKEVTAQQVAPVKEEVVKEQVVQSGQDNTGNDTK